MAIGVASALRLGARYQRRNHGLEATWGILRSMYVTLFACLPLPSLFVRYAHLTVMISMSRERGLLWLRHDRLCNHGTSLWNQLLPSTRSTLLTGVPSASFRSLKTALFSL